MNVLIYHYNKYIECYSMNKLKEHNFIEQVEYHYSNEKMQHYILVGLDAASSYTGIWLMSCQTSVSLIWVKSS